MAEEKKMAVKEEDLDLLLEIVEERKAAKAKAKPEAPKTEGKKESLTLAERIAKRKAEMQGATAKHEAPQAKEQVPEDVEKAFSVACDKIKVPKANRALLFLAIEKEAGEAEVDLETALQSVVKKYPILLRGAGIPNVSGMITKTRTEDVEKLSLEERKNPLRKALGIIR